MSFIPRLYKPSVTDLHFINTNFGGLNSCIVVNTTTGSVLPNCTGYCWGRWYELFNSRPNLSTGMARDWFSYNDGYERSQQPNLGSIICWSGGNSGGGHVAVVEKIYPDGRIYTSNSAFLEEGTYSDYEYWFPEVLSPSNNYQRPQGGVYNFQGFILNPNEPKTFKKKLPWIYYLKQL